MGVYSLNPSKYFEFQKGLNLKLSRIPGAFSIPSHKILNLLNRGYTVFSVKAHLHL